MNTEDTTPVGHAYPLLYQPRPWSAVGDPVGTDARWRNVPPSRNFPSTVQAIDRLRVKDLQRNAK